MLLRLARKPSAVVNCSKELRQARMKRNIRNRAAVCLWLAGFAVLAALPAPAQVPQPPTGSINSIRFSGLTRTSPAFARDIVRIPTGVPADPAVLEEAVNRLLRTGRFLSARYGLTEEPDGVIVTFTVTEHGEVTALRFEGNKAIKDGPLREVVAIKPGERVDQLAAQLGVEAIIAKYRGQGYRDVSVTYDRDRLIRTGELTYAVQEGRRVRIRKVLFEGNTFFSGSVLRRQVDTKRAFWFFRKGAFDQERVEADLAQLQRYYSDQGFLDARVSYRVDAGKTAADLIVVFMVVEGTRYTIENIDFRGVATFQIDEFTSIMESRVGAPVKQPQVDRDVRAIQDIYLSQGFIHATVRPVRVFSDTPGLVRISIEVSEGAQFRVGQIVVRGNARTRDKVARRELNLYPPDDLLDLVEAREAEQRLKEIGAFNAARVLPVGNLPDVRDVIIDVEESPKSGDFLFGLGVTSNSGLLGNVILDLKNFDITDRPRSWKELFKFRSFFGGGQRLRVELQPGTDLSRFRIDFTEPFLGDKPTRFDLGAYLFTRGRDGYDEQRVGMTVSFGKRFRRGRLHGWSGELSFRLERVRIEDIDLFAASDIHDDEGSHLLTSAKVTLVRDRTDNRFLPTTGDRFRVSYEQFGIFGGEHGFGKLLAKYQRYKTIKTDLLDRKSVLQLRAEAGTILGDAPIFERFYAGGTGSIRGFDFRGVGPHEGFDDNNVGGDFLLLLGAEYSYPLFGENVRGHVFLDTGTAGTGTYRAAIGTGIRLTINIFGPVPLEFNIAAPISTGSDDETQVFSFLIGRIF